MTNSMELTEQQRADLLTLIARKRALNKHDGIDSSMMRTRNLAARTAAYCETKEKLEETIAYLCYILSHYETIWKATE